MYRVLVNGFVRNVKAQQQIILNASHIAECFAEKASRINNQLFRFASTKDNKSEEQKILHESRCKKINAKLVLHNVDMSSDGDKNTVDKPEKKDDHTKIWYVERIVSASLALIVPAALVNPCPALDVALALAFVMHNYWALESVCADYINPSTFGTTVPKAVDFLVVILSVVTLAGLFCFIHNDVGIAQSLLCLWTVGKEEEDAEAPAEIKDIVKDESKPGK